MSKLRNPLFCPTLEQNFASVCVCQMLSNYYRNIELFRFNERTGEIYIFASEELQIIIPRSGSWRFV
ncbi:DUF6888 family protein [Kovacikia minuta]|uniref:DUF6888 family protein n=1 Tax=Kovacikia minuta TaxID=2931930 RepID=UPI0036F3CD01